MRAGDVMTGQTVAHEVLRRLGCHPDALTVKEPSMAVWLLAARFAKDAEASLFKPVEHGLWPDFFMAPENRCREPSMFLGGYVDGCRRQGLEVHEANFTAVTGSDFVDYDRRVLKNWLDYARARLAKIERRNIVWTLADSLSNGAAQAKIRRAS